MSSDDHMLVWIGVTAAIALAPFRVLVRARVIVSLLATVGIAYCSTSPAAAFFFYAQVTIPLCLFGSILARYRAPIWKFMNDSQELTTES